jgi:hypothetical protein
MKKQTKEDIVNTLTDTLIFVGVYLMLYGIIKLCE